MASQNQLNDLMLKKFQYAPFSDTNQQASLETAGSSAFKIPASNIWNQAIPAVAPTKGSTTALPNSAGTKYSTSVAYISFYEKVVLAPVNAGIAFRYTNTDPNDVLGTNILISAIPSNFDPNLSYLITVYDAADQSVAQNGSNPWYFDNCSGILTFFVSIGYTPKISFWRYEGTTGTSSTETNNVWTGTNAFNTYLPTSTLTPTNATDLVTKTYADNQVPQAVLNANNTWQGTNLYLNAVTVGQASVNVDSLVSGTGVYSKSVSYNPVSATTQSTYNYFLFTGNGSFIFNTIGTTSVTFYYVVIGGGGAGGTGGGTKNYGSGAGGGGGQVQFGSVALTADTTFAVTVGAGGTFRVGGQNGNGGGSSSLIGGSVSVTAAGGSGGSTTGGTPTNGGKGGNSGSGAVGGNGGTAGVNGSNGVVVSNSGSGGGGGGYGATAVSSGGSSTYTFAGDGSTYQFSTGGGGGFRSSGGVNTNPPANTTYGSGNFGSPNNNAAGNGLAGCVLIYYVNTQTVTPSASASLTSNAGMSIQGTNVINFGYDVTKEANAGKIGYGTFIAGTLNIVGGGLPASTRYVDLWDILRVQSSITAGGNITAQGQIYQPNVTQYVLNGSTGVNVVSNNVWYLCASQAVGVGMWMVTGHHTSNAAASTSMSAAGIATNNTGIVGSFIYNLNSTNSNLIYMSEQIYSSGGNYPTVSFSYTTTYYTSATTLYFYGAGSTNGMSYRIQVTRIA